jgi:hypothetical protein
MTHDPHLPTLEEVMNGSPFDIVDSPLGHIERWRASTLATGTMGALAQVATIVKNDAAALEQKTAALDAKKSAVLSTVNRLLRFMSRVDALTTRVQALEAKHKADEAQRQKFDEEPLELPPDFDRPQDLPPAKVGDETHQPGGELHSVPPKDEPSSELPEPPLETQSKGEGDDMGGVPLSYKNVPTSYVRGGPKDAAASKDQAGDLPEELEQDLPEPPTEPRGSVYPQPVSISLNKA